MYWPLPAVLPSFYLVVLTCLCYEPWIGPDSKLVLASEFWYDKDFKKGTKI